MSHIPYVIYVLFVVIYYKQHINSTNTSCRKVLIISKDDEAISGQRGYQFPTTYQESPVRADLNRTYIYFRGDGHEGVTIPE